MGYELRPERPVEGEDLAKLYPDFDPAAAYGRFNKVGADYGLTFQPVTFLPNTRLALVATEYAKDQGLFEQFHAHVFKAYFTEGKNIGSQEVLLDIAAALGLDKEKVAAALVNPQYTKRLDDNRQAGLKWQVTGLPTFILQNQQRIVGAQSYEAFKRAVEQYLK
ncbi:DsbA family oxidoreductase [Desulfotomaculum defluvii]